MIKKNPAWTDKSNALLRLYLKAYNLDGESEQLLRLAIDYYDLQVRALQELQEKGNLVATGTGSFKPNPIANNIAKYNSCMINTLKLIGVQKVE